MRLPNVESEDLGPLRRDRGFEVYLEQVSPLEQGIVDLARLDQEGVYRFELGGVAKTPALYNIVCNGERIPSSSPPATA